MHRPARTIPLTAALTAALVAALAASGPARAQAYPSRPIRVITPWVAGSNTDLTSRALGAGMSSRLGQSVLVENKPGATGNIGYEYVASSPADGYTLLILVNVIANSRALDRKPFDAKKEITPIACVTDSITFLEVNPKVVGGARTFKELLAWAKANPTVTLQYGSSGNGSFTHLAQAMLQNRFGLNMNHVPYKSLPPAVLDAAGGRVALVMGDLSSSGAYVRAGTLVPILQLLPQRAASMPDVPTARELGYPELEVDLTIGLAGPPKLPAAITERLSAVVKEAVNEKSFQDFVRNQGNGVIYMDAEAYAASLDDAYAKWSKVVKDNNLRPDS